EYNPSFPFDDFNGRQPPETEAGRIELAGLLAKNAITKTVFTAMQNPQNFPVLLRTNLMGNINSLLPGNNFSNIRSIAQASICDQLVLDYIGENISGKIKNKSYRCAQKKDIDFFIRRCLVNMPDGPLAIRERPDFESTIKTAVSWDNNKPQFFEVTVNREKFVVKVSYRYSEFDDCINFMKQYRNWSTEDITFAQENIILPIAFGCWRVTGNMQPQDRLVKFYDVGISSTDAIDNKITTLSTMKNEYKNVLVSNNEYRLDSQHLKNQIHCQAIFQFMRLAQGKAFDLLTMVDKIDLNMFHIGEVTGNLIARLHSIGFDYNNTGRMFMIGDLHPGNFIYDKSSDTVKIIDPGFSRAIVGADVSCYDKIDNDFARLINFAMPTVDENAISNDVAIEGANTSKYDVANRGLLLEGILTGYRRQSPEIFKLLTDLNNAVMRSHLFYEQFLTLLTRAFNHASPTALTLMMYYWKILLPHFTPITFTATNLSNSSNNHAKYAGTILLSSLTNQEKIEQCMIIKSGIAQLAQFRGLYSRWSEIIFTLEISADLDSFQATNSPLARKAATMALLSRDDGVIAKIMRLNYIGGMLHISLVRNKTLDAFTGILGRIDESAGSISLVNNLSTSSDVVSPSESAPAASLSFNSETQLPGHGEAQDDELTIADVVSPSESTSAASSSLNSETQSPWHSEAQDDEPTGVVEHVHAFFVHVKSFITKLFRIKSS
ncbi:MAG: hypothetical protein LBB21_00530, partial [Holosporaceae bacterium]|nr:hypothetical protein [Holosporaceae bacterium]